MEQPWRWGYNKTATDDGTTVVFGENVLHTRNEF